MMRLPEFQYRGARSLDEATALLAAAPADTMLVAGGTDVLPNMKRRQQVPKILVGLRGVSELRRIRQADGPGGLVLGGGLTLTALVHHADVRGRYAGLWQAAAQVATPHLRNMGTLGGNLCLDTRCTYYDQSHEWRKAINFCMKKDGDICWVATSSPRCLAVSSTDTAPALMALGAQVRLVSAATGSRIVDLDALYNNDGIAYLTRRPDEVLADVTLPASDGWRSTYWKLRRRGSFDFPVLSVAAAARFDGDRVAEARIVLGAVASRPMPAPAAAAALVGRRLDDEAIAEAADLAFGVAKPMDNTDFTLVWRKRVSRAFVTYALRELRGDDMRECRQRIARQTLEQVA